jgi:hypothetical protein
MSAASLQATAKRLIAKHGRAVTLVKAGVTIHEAGSPWRGPAQSATEAEPDPAPAAGATETAATAVILDYTERDNPDAVKRGSKRALVAATDIGVAIDVATYSVLIDGDARYRIAKAIDIKPGATRFLWDLEITQ